MCQCNCSFTGSFGGGRTLSISGSGFGDETSTTVTVCGNECPILSIGSNLIQCDVPGRESKLFHFQWMQNLVTWTVP